MNQKEAESVKGLARPCNDVLGKLGWKWEPQDGDWIIEKEPNQTVRYGDKKCQSVPHIVIGIAYYKDDNDIHVITPASHVTIVQSNAIPILHWEEIEKILEKFEWVLYDMAKTVPSSKEDSLWVATLAKNKQWKNGRGSTRQEAVMRTVIKLREIINAPHPHD